jgi:hypothetical protein
MWEHYKMPGEDEDAEVCRPCGRFSLYAGDVLLGHSELDRETIGEEGFYRVGEFEPVWDGYLRFQGAFVRYNELKLERELRLPAYKNMPEFDTAERQVQALSLRLVAPNGEDVPTRRLEVGDFGRGNGCDLEIFISEEPVYLRFFPPDAKKI